MYLFAGVSGGFRIARARAAACVASFLPRPASLQSADVLQSKPALRICHLRKSFFASLVSGNP